MGVWNIGRIRGRFQPEDFTETQNAKVKDLVVWGTVTRVMHAGWEPREVTFSFIVDSIHTTDNDGGRRRVAYNSSQECPVYDPEEVWSYIQSIQRPWPRPSYMKPIPVYIPGWGVRNEEVKYAFITSASIKRTHITDKNAQYAQNPSSIRAVRATFTVTLKEAVFFETAEEAQKAGQSVYTGRMVTAASGPA